MSVLIKGKALPKDCESCDLCDYYGCCYALCGDSLWDALPDGAEYFPDGWKYAGCPLVEIPEPHGDLIDRDAFRADFSMGENCDNCGIELKRCEYDRIYTKMDFCGWLDDAPTVIEAEGSEDNE